MEKSGKIEDGVMDNLLQGFIKRQMKLDSICEAFDPDLANAYLERVMTPKEQTRYESHLSGCAPCRQQVIALARLVDAEVAEVKVAAVAAGAPAPLNESPVVAHHTTLVGAARPHWLARLKGWLCVWATPRFALTAAAAIILAITIPYVLIQNSKVSPSEIASSPAKAKEAGQAPQQAPAKNSPEANSSGSSSINQTADPQNQPAHNKQQGPESKPSATPTATGAAATPAA